MSGIDVLVIAPWVAFGVIVMSICFRLLSVHHRTARLPKPRPRQSRIPRPRRASETVSRRGSRASPGPGRQPGSTQRTGRSTQSGPANTPQPHRRDHADDDEDRDQVKVR